MAARRRARTAWHPLFAALLEERKPPGFEIQTEVQLSSEPQRADLLLIRRGPEIGEGRVLRGLWPRLAKQTVAEFKSSTRPPRAGDLLRLVGYGLQHHVKRLKELPTVEDLTLVLLAPTINRALRADLTRMGWSLEPEDPGFYRVVGAPYRSYLVSVRDAAAREHDPLLGVFADRTLRGLNLEAAEWLRDHVAESMELKMANERENQEIERKIASWFVERGRMDVFTNEERLEGLTPEERLEGLDQRDLLLALPLDVLRALPQSYIDGLPEDLREQVLARLRH